MCTLNCLWLKYLVCLNRTTTESMSHISIRLNTHSSHFYKCLVWNQMLITPCVPYFNACPRPCLFKDVGTYILMGQWWSSSVADVLLWWATAMTDMKKLLDLLEQLLLHNNMRAHLVCFVWHTASCSPAFPKTVNPYECNCLMYKQQALTDSTLQSNYSILQVVL